MARGERLDGRAIQPAHLKPLRQRVRQPVVKAFGQPATIRPAVARLLRADLVPGRNLHGHRARARALKAFHGGQRAAPARRARRQEDGAAAKPLPDAPQRRIQRGHRLADARGRLRKEPLALAQGDVHVRRKPALPRPVCLKGKRQAGQRRVPRGAARELLFFPCGGGGAQAFKLRAQRRRVPLLFIGGEPFAARIHVEHAQADARLRLTGAEHVPVHRRLRHVRGHERLIRRAQLDLLDHRRAVRARKDAVRAARDAQHERLAQVVGAERHLAAIRRLLRARLPPAVGYGALLHALRGVARRRQVVRVQRRLHHRAHAHAHDGAAHPRLRMRESAAMSHAPPSSETKHAAVQIAGASYHTQIRTPSPPGTP